MGLNNPFPRMIDKFFTIQPFRPAPNQQGDGVLGHLSTVLGAGILNLNVPRKVNEVMVQATAQNIRFTTSGTAPTAASGFQLVAGDPPVIIPYVEGRTVLQFIREANGAVLELQYGE